MFYYYLTASCSEVKISVGGLGLELNLVIKLWKIKWVFQTPDETQCYLPTSFKHYIS